MKKPEIPVWIYEPPMSGPFPFVAAVLEPGLKLTLQPFGTREDAQAFVEKRVIDLLATGPGSKK